MEEEKPQRPGTEPLPGLRDLLLCRMPEGTCLGDGHHSVRPPRVPRQRQVPSRDTGRPTPGKTLEARQTERAPEEADPAEAIEGMLKIGCFYVL